MQTKKDTNFLPGSTILLVEDDPVISEIIKMPIEHLGGKIKLATTISQSQKALLNTPEGISMVICDFHLIDGNGLDLITVARTTFPNLPFLFISGEDLNFGDSICHHDFSQTAFLKKPFSFSSLISEINKLFSCTQ